MSSERQLLCFSLAGRPLSLWSETIVEVLRLVALQPLGDLNPALLGVLNRRGQIVTVYDLRLALGLPEAQPGLTDLLVILQTRAGPCAIVVDAVTDIVAVPAGQATPNEGLPGLSRYVAEVVNLGDRMVPVLDLEWLLSQGGMLAGAD